MVRPRLISIFIDQTETQTRGRGYWKFNNSLLNDLEYIQLIKNTINSVKIEVTSENKNFIWEFAKCKIRTESMNYASKKAIERNKLQKELEEKLKLLEKQLITDNSVQTQYIKCKTDWEDILKIKAEGIKLRSKAKWI